MYKICVTGSRRWEDKDTIAHYLGQVVAEICFREQTPDKPFLVKGNFLLIEGGAKGADRIAREVADNLDIDVVTVNADWDKYGKKAGMIRNRKMLDDHNPDILLAFPKANSVGTIGCIAEAIRMEIPITIKYESR